MNQRLTWDEIPQPSTWDNPRLGWMIIAGNDAAKEQQEIVRSKHTNKQREIPLDLKSFNEGYEAGILNATHYALMALEAYKNGRKPSIAELIKDE